MWSLFNKEKELKPLKFSNNKTQEDVVSEVLKAIGEGYKIIFIKGMCGTGKSAIALNLAKEFKRTSIVVPIKSLQEQYTKDYTDGMYILRDKKNQNTKLKISPIFGRSNFPCKYLENKEIKPIFKLEKNLKLNEIFSGKKPAFSEKDKTCNNPYLPCKIELKERNLNKIKEYIKENPDINIADFDSIKDVRRMSIAVVCPFWSPILPKELNIKKFHGIKQTKYKGLGDKEFIIYQRQEGCGYYDQYQSYANSDVLIFNSLKYKLETLMERKPATNLEIIDECDEFLDSFSNQEQINLTRLIFACSGIFTETQKQAEVLQEIIDISNEIINSEKLKNNFSKEVFSIKDTKILELLELVLKNFNLFEEIEENIGYLAHLKEVALLFEGFFNETYYSAEFNNKEIILKLVTTNLAKRLKELIEKNKIVVMMSGTIHNEIVLKNIFGIENFKIIEAETKTQGALIKCKHGYEIDCKYSNFQSQKITREKYLKAFSKSVSCAKRPTLVHVNSFSDLPTNIEKEQWNLENLPTQNELIEEQKNDPFGEKIKDFKNKKIKILFTTKCSRGVDFPGDTCNSIVISRFPYPNISNIFWKILKKTHPGYFMSFYMDKAKRELLQRVYRGLRSKEDRVYLLSPDIRVIEFDFENN